MGARNFSTNNSSATAFQSNSFRGNENNDEKLGNNGKLY